MEAKYLFIALGAGVVIGTLLALVYTYYLKAKWGALSKEKASIIDEAQRESESIKKEARVEAKDIIFQSRAEADKELNERRNELSQLERRLMQKDETLERKLEQVEKRDGEINKREKDIASQEQSIRDRKAHLEGLVKEQKDTLERLSGITSDEARTELFKRIEDESRLEASKLAKRMEDEAVEQAEKKAQEIVSSTIQRYASDYIADATVSSVSLPSDELKGRIIGREGRNIRALEAATGVDFIVDDTPEVVTLSAFDPVRREIARLALEKLIADGRIHPARIEEIAVKVKKEVDAIIVEEGEKSVFDLGLAGIHPELIKLLGRLKYRTSYGQNVLQHSREVAYLAGMMAGELGVDVKLAKRAGLLHDIGKAIDHEIEGSHHEIGATLAKKYGEKDVVVNAIGAHHGDIEVDSVEASLVAAADALSAARPGVRRESIENYIKRLQQLEEMAMWYDGVEKCFAVQAGREVRLIVKPDKINDDMSWNIAKELSKKIEQEMSYPGQIKVTVIRESRYVEYAK